MPADRLVVTVLASDAPEGVDRALHVAVFTATDAEVRPPVPAPSGRELEVEVPDGAEVVLIYDHGPDAPGGGSMAFVAAEGAPPQARAGCPAVGGIRRAQEPPARVEDRAEEDRPAEDAAPAEDRPEGDFAG